MCGIIGAVGVADATPLLLAGLRRLEYRGYDSTGVATLVNGKIERRRSTDRRHSERRHGERRLRIRDSVERRLGERRGGERRPGNWRDSLGQGAPTDTSDTGDAAEAAPVSALLRPRRSG